jgi:glycosyltransferase involved in cell wall biosynthesis
LNDESLTLALAGGNPRSIFRNISIARDTRVELLGQVTDGPLKALYSHALCFVFPSRYEGFGIPPLEAMSCGCPVVVARSSSLPEVCGDGALYCDPEDPADLAARIREIRDDPDRVASLIGQGRERAGRFSWLESSRKILSVIEEHA